MTLPNQPEPFVDQVEIEELEPRAVSSIAGSLATKDVVTFIGLFCSFVADALRFGRKKQVQV